ncbi:MAG: RpoL/Rpb11 RNA polymerase subunit family protein [Candidatus Micrarchaeia archaeon]
MEIKIINHEKTLLEFEIFGHESYTLPELITGALSKNDAVEFVSYKVDHPTVGKPRIVVRTKSKDALDLTLGAIDDMRSQITDLKKALKKAK